MSASRPLICTSCAKDEHLWYNVSLAAREQGNCIICLKAGDAADLGAELRLRKFCRFLIRYHFPEQAYNPSFGGTPLLQLLKQENPILNHRFADTQDRAARQTEIDAFLNFVFDIGNSGGEIPLFAGTDQQGKEGMFHTAIKDGKSATWYHYKHELKSKNFFLLEEEAKKQFLNLRDEVSDTLSEGMEYFRARIGYLGVKEAMGNTLMRVKLPFQREELSAPRPFESRAGRANRSGVSFLYLASDKETALAEVRPHPGHYVTVGKFSCRAKLNVANLRFVNLMKYFESESQLEEFRFLNDVSRELSIPVLPDEQQNYLVTQFISDILRQIGFDGVLYRSSVSDGHNLVVFDANHFSYVEESAELIKVTQVSYECEPVEYFVDGLSYEGP